MSKRISNYLKGYEGKNPFRDRKSSSFGDERIATEFQPTTKFWSLFNDGHEVLLGTRGSGKTVLLRMLSYKCLSEFAAKSKNAKATKLVTDKEFIGFYIPMHLEFAAALSEELSGSAAPDDDAKSTVTFDFSFNCVAATGLLEQLPKLIEDCSQSKKEKLIRQCEIIEKLTHWWFPECGFVFSSIEAMRDKIMHIFQSTEEDAIGVKKATRLLAKPVLRPILNVLSTLSEILGLSPDRTRWVACIDEAEFLHPIHIRAINSFLRDEKRPLVVKMATLPFAHRTRKTLFPEIDVETDDFTYNWIDMEPDSDDFEVVSNHICRVRLRNISLNDNDKWGQFIENGCLDDFVGRVGNDEPIDYFREEINWSESEWQEEHLLRKIVGELSPQRQKHFKESSQTVDQARQPITKRFRPVYFMRVMKSEHSKGNRKVGWFAGAETIRRIADGNPRIFIQIMNILVEASRTGLLTPKEQHQRLQAFCERRHENSQGLPQHGVTVKAFIDTVASHLAERVHGQYMLDSGCHFTLSDTLLSEEVITEALKVAISYSHIRIPDVQDVQFSGLSDKTDFRLGYSYAAEYWLPMRKGSPPCIRSKEQAEFQGLLKEEPPTTGLEARDLIKQLRIEFNDE